MKALITSALTARAYRLKNQLITRDVIMGDYNEIPALMLQPAKIVQLPNPGESSYPHQMLALCLDNEVTEVYPLNPKENDALKPVVQLFAEYGIEIQFVKNDL